MARANRWQCLRRRCQSSTLADAQEVVRVLSLMAARREVFLLKSDGLDIEDSQLEDGGASVMDLAALAQVNGALSSSSMPAM